MELYVRELALAEPVPADSYLAGLPVVQALTREPLTFTRPVTFFVGENGVGKSTLIEGLAVALGFNPEGGSRNFSFSTSDSHSPLYRSLRVVKGVRHPRDGFFLRAESFYNAASYLDEVETGYGGTGFAAYGGISLHAQSHGESFLSLVENRFGGQGLYILDEPEAALSPTRLMTLMVNLQRLVRQQSQFIIATHSPILMTFPGAEIFEITPEGIQSVPYQATEHYQVTRQFLESPERMLRYLLEEE